MSKVEGEIVESGTRRTVVAAVDESAQADDVFQFVCQNFNSPDTLVVFTYVAKPLDSLFNTSAKFRETEAKGYLAEGWVKHAAELKVQMKCVGKVLVGDPREELCALCEHLRPNALVMGSHGRRVLARVMLGSVSNYCVHFCCCPVVVVKPRKDHDFSGYSTVFRLAAKTLGMHHVLQEKTKPGAALALAEAARKERETKGEQEGEGGGGHIELEDALPMDNPFPPSEPDATGFPASDAPFAVSLGNASKDGGARTAKTEEVSVGEGGKARKKGKEEEVQETQSLFSRGDNGPETLQVTGDQFPGSVQDAHPGVA